MDLSSDDKRLLANGTKFVPTPKDDAAAILNDFKLFKRRTRLRVQFADQNDQLEQFNNKFHIQSSSWQPDPAPDDVETYLENTRDDLKAAIALYQVSRPRSNINATQRRFLQSMKQSKDYIIKPADKNLGLTLMDRSWYDAEVLRQLSDANTYRPVTYDAIPTKAIYRNILALATQASAQELISKQVFIYLKAKITPDTARIPQIYILPKVHKPKLAGRPIIPGTHWITTPASVLVDHLLQPLLKRVPTVIADSKSIVVELNTRAFPNADLRLITADVSSLYTEIPTNKGLAFVTQLMREHPDLISPPLLTFISALLRIVMENNYFQFNGQYYHQIKGTAMGTPAAVIFANIFMYILERGVLMKYANDIAFYKRYLDDIFMVAHGNSDAIKASLQSMEKNIKLEFNDSDRTATFLDITFFKGTRFDSSRILDTKVHQKQLNMYLYIPYNSSHPDKSKSGFITAELKRYVRNTSTFDDYLETKKLLWTRLRARGYPPDFLTKAFAKVKFSTRSQLLLPPKAKTVDSKVYFTTEFTPLTSRLPLKEIFTKHLTVFEARTLVPGIGFKNTPNLHHTLAQNRITAPPAVPPPLAE